MAPLTTEQLALVMGNNWFSQLPLAVRSDILDVARRRTLTSGSALYVKGQEPDGWFCVLSGAIRVGSTTEQGRGAVLRWLEPRGMVRRDLHARWPAAHP